MRPIRAVLFSAIIGAAFAGSAALADEPMGRAQLDALLTGNTLYLDVPPGSPGAPDGGTAPIYYAEDGSAAAKLPAGLKLIGRWALDETRYCIDWKNGPQNSCTMLVRRSDGLIAIDEAQGEPRGTVTRIVVGNPENL